MKSTDIRQVQRVAESMALEVLQQAVLMARSDPARADVYPILKFTLDRRLPSPTEEKSQNDGLIPLGEANQTGESNGGGESGESSWGLFDKYAPPYPESDLEFYHRWNLILVGNFTRAFLAALGLGATCGVWAMWFFAPLSEVCK